MERQGSMLARGTGPGRFEHQWRVERGGVGYQRRVESGAVEMEESGRAGRALALRLLVDFPIVLKRLTTG